MKKETRRERRLRREKIAKARRRKVCTRVTLLVMMLTFSAILSVNAITTVFAKDTSEFYTITVSYGDTLWDIAKEVNHSSKDLRKVVDSIMRANDMKTTVVYAGDVLNIPMN